MLTSLSYFSADVTPQDKIDDQTEKSEEENEGELAEFENGQQIYTLLLVWCSIKALIHKFQALRNLVWAIRSVNRKQF